MNSDVRDRIEGYLDAIESAANTAGGFVVEQAPHVAQEYLVWRFWSNVAIAIVCAVVIIVWLAYVRRIWKLAGDTVYHSINAEFATKVSGSLIMLPAVVGFLVSSFCAIKVCVAPRLVLLEKVSSLISGG